MRDILTTIYHDDPLAIRTISSLEDPRSREEQKVAAQLRVIEKADAEALKHNIEALADRQAEDSFYKGVRFGAQLMAQLLAR